MAGEFVGLVTDNQVGQVVLGIEAAVAESFATDQARLTVARDIRVTQDEVKRRANICMRIFRELRGDLKWGVHKILDQLPVYLRKELDGVAWKPSDASFWTPEVDIK